MSGDAKASQSLRVSLGGVAGARRSAGRRRPCAGSALSVGEGKELSIKHREMVIIGILAFRGREDGVVVHMRRAVQHGATKRELLEAVQAAAVPGGGPTLSAGVKALMQLETEGAFKRG